MDLSGEDQRRVEAEVRRMVAELRARPTQEKEDALGVAIALMPPAEREHVTTVLLRMLREDVSSTSFDAIRKHLGHEPGTLADFEAEYGSVQPPDGEG
jgi:hypothetical protein